MNTGPYLVFDNKRLTRYKQFCLRRHLIWVLFVWSSETSTTIWNKCRANRSNRLLIPSYWTAQVYTVYKYEVGNNYINYLFNIHFTCVFQRNFRTFNLWKNLRYTMRSVITEWEIYHIVLPLHVYYSMEKE